jgi:hypothetical protein
LRPSQCKRCYRQQRQCQRQQDRQHSFRVFSHLPIRSFHGCYFVATFSTLSHRGSENMGAFTLIRVAPSEFVAFSFMVPNLSLKSFALFFSAL